MAALTSQNLPTANWSTKKQITIEKDLFFNSHFGQGTAIVVLNICVHRLGPPLPVLRCLGNLINYGIMERHLC